MKKSLLLVFVAVLMAAGIWSTPYIAVYQIRQAAEAGDSKSISEKVNFPILKENLKIKFMTSMNQHMEDLKDNPFSGFAQMMMLPLVNSMVDAYISPSGLALMLDGIKPMKEKGSAAAKLKTSNPPKDDLAINYAYVSLNTFKITVSNKNSPSDTFTFVLNRDGILRWQLVDIDIPSLDKQP
jgi:hypothetical protein